GSTESVPTVASRSPRRDSRHAPKQPSASTARCGANARGGSPMKPDHEQRVRELEQKLERGWITLEEILVLASGSPVDLDDATELGRRAGIKLIDDDASNVWEDIEKLAHEGQRAFAEPVREGPVPVEELNVGDPTSL